MGYELLYVHRLSKRKDETIVGHMYLKKPDAKKWEQLCYSYELPLKTDSSGKTKKEVSCIAANTYEMKVRIGGNKGWRLELMSTGHRDNVQVHRAHKSLYIEGCILPITASGALGGDQAQSESVELMGKIKEAYDAWKAKGQAGRPTITITYGRPASS